MRKVALFMKNASLYCQVHVGEKKTKINTTTLMKVIMFCVRLERRGFKFKIL